MTGFNEPLKNFIRKSAWTYPVRLIRSVLLLPRLKKNLEELQRTVSGLEETRVQQLPPSFVKPCPPFLSRAEKRIRSKDMNISPETRKQHFYSYFSEAGDENYDGSIQSQYASYLPFIPQGVSDPFLDIGCGAGEFLLFLKKNKVNVKGIDSNKVEIKRAASRGLDVECADAYEFLSSTNEKFSGISLIEVIEHLPFEKVQPLVEIAIARLAENGILLIETINLRHPTALSCFFSDPTHVRPISDDYLGFLFQWFGLEDVQIIYTSPNREPGVFHNDMNRLYFCFAVFGRKKRSS